MASALLCYGFKKIAPKLCLTDSAKNNNRKHHSGAPAQVGGLGIIITFFAVILAFIPVSFDPVPLLMGTGLLLLLGVYDDSHHIPVVPKLLTQIMIVVSVVFLWGFTLENLGQITNGNNVLALSSTIAPIVTGVCILAFINAYNLIDGLDGLAGGLASIILTIMVCIALSGGLYSIAFIIGIFIASLVGFLTFNMRHPFQKRASIFLGDGGSLSIGFMISWSAIMLGNAYAFNQDVLPPPIVYAFLLAYPIYDMIAVMITRALKRKSIFTPDNLHLHFLLKDKGLSDGQVCWLLILFAIIYSAIGLLGDYFGLSQLSLALLWCVIIPCHLAIYRYAQK